MIEILSFSFNVSISMIYEEPREESEDDFL
jgi:hypothetical protein